MYDIASAPLLLLLATVVCRELTSLMAQIRMEMVMALM